MTTTEVTIETTVEETDEINICDECGREASDAIRYEVAVAQSRDHDLEPLHFCDEDCVDKHRATQPRAPAADGQDDETGDTRLIAELSIEKEPLSWRDITPRLKSAAKRLWAPYDETGERSTLTMLIVVFGFVPVIGIASPIASYLVGIDKEDNMDIQDGHLSFVAQITSLLVVAYWDTITTLVTAVSYDTLLDVGMMLLIVMVMWIIGWTVLYGPRA